MGERIRATYLLETGLDPDAVAGVMAGEQSSGTFVAVPGETPELRRRAGAVVERVERLDTVAEPSLPGAARPPDGARYSRARVEISWPLDNIGPSLPNLMATVAGNLFELREVSGLRLLDIALPRAFAQACPGPAFGVEGTRRLAGVEGRPLIGTIIKPSIGLGPAETAGLVDGLCAAGIDFVKDDELQSDGAHCPFEARVKAVMEVVARHADRTGRKPMVAFNLTGEVDEMRRRHDVVAEHGGTCVMVSLNSVGLAGLMALRRHCALPIHAHRNGWGYLSRHPMLGWSYRAWQTLWRLAGADHMHVNGLDNKFCEANDSVVASARACLEPLFDDRPMTAMPVFSSGQSARQAAATYEALGSVDLIYAAGGGIMAHPAGPAAGVASLREAWEAAVKGIPAETYARSHEALRTALEAYR
ncbi:ribulose-bisphosphate carboxylase large subunit family protein [Kaustia mangrovi]|uniref:Ribulose-bisphosphate carboxylase large subunit family protein n=1 Tax=Kaustia mangrovi TaxID=2593653 RepID=A0A7S8C3U9_9HYPH|nr:ribulose-bisphosphate carboxylase large subunit family protein [Kaustia mangrovi]QPC42817.1 ribulose-bisphosphate carboxylase large subunit family protein [Kaustia mangrovi]